MTLQIAKLNPNLTETISVFFQTVESDKFHPHGFDPSDAYKLCNYTGKDLYYAMINEEDVVAYGLLRGWDNGFKDPTLGIYVSSKYRKMGIAKMFMSFLHLSAKLMGADKTILKVYKDNYKAINLYTLCGYVFNDFDEKQLIGTLKL